MCASPSLFIPPLPRVVLDTNVVFDWLVFRNPGCAPLAAALEAGHLQWIASNAMQDEFFHVLDRGRLDAWTPDRPALQAAWATHRHPVDPPPPAAPPPALRCTDPDDQKFIDLAVDAGARWLFSRDRAVRRLARPLRLLGVEVGPPEAWRVGG